MLELKEFLTTDVDMCVKETALTRQNPAGHLDS